MREVIGAYQANVAEVSKRWDGHLAKYMGDGVLVYFGWPQAHEDDAERAVRAGLELAQTTAALRPAANSTLKARVGIATGHVVVGDLGSPETADKDAVVGETPNLAARLQSLAGPDSVVISQATRRLLGGLFELDDLGPQCLKGFAEPLAVCRVSDESKAEGRFEARRTTGLTPLVGRDEELSLLLRRLESWASRSRPRAWLCTRMLASTLHAASRSRSRMPDHAPSRRRTPIAQTNACRSPILIRRPRSALTLLDLLRKG
jgi:hypothetical protein